MMTNVMPNNMKKSIYILILLTIFNCAIIAQNADTTVWLNYSYESLYFKYPSYFKINNTNDDELSFENDLRIADIEYTYYSELGTAKEYNFGDTFKGDKYIYLEMPSSFKVVISKYNFIDFINNYLRFIFNCDSSDTIKFNDKWLSNNDNAVNINLSNNIILYCVNTPTSSYIKGDGCWSKASSEATYLGNLYLFNNINLYIIGRGFSFPNGENIMFDICKSIRCLNK
jgi:hypothetical protein